MPAEQRLVAVVAAPDRGSGLVSWSRAQPRSSSSGSSSARLKPRVASLVPLMITCRLAVRVPSVIAYSSLIPSKPRGEPKFFT